MCDLHQVISDFCKVEEIDSNRSDALCSLNPAVLAKSLRRETNAGVYTGHNVASILANFSLMANASECFKTRASPNHASYLCCLYVASMALVPPTQTMSSGDFAITTFSATFPFSSLKNIVALTTPFAYESDCLSRWLLSSSRSGETPTIYSLSPSGSTIDPRWTSCQPLNYQTLYSPAVCPEGRTLGLVQEAEYTESNTKKSEYVGFCCER